MDLKVSGPLSSWVLIYPCKGDSSWATGLSAKQTTTLEDFPYQDQEQQPPFRQHPKDYPCYGLIGCLH